MKDSVTTGEDLNSYQGNAALAGTGNDVGYAKIDISPLETYALKKYETNYRDYEQQQQDKKDLEKQFTDPKLFVPLDKHYAEQINPKLERLQELSKSNLEMNPNSHDWYEFKDLYNEIIKDNAQAKTVQTMKDNAKEAMGKSADQHEKERLNAYIQQLDQHKIGEDVPVYNKYFAPVDAHLPNLETKTGQIERINGNTIEKVKTTVYNPMNADVLAQRNLVSTPEAANTYADIAHTLLENGGIEDVNKSLADVYTKGLRLNIDDLKNKYSKEYTSYLKTNPNGSFQNFLDDTGRANELHNIRDGHQYLKEPLEYVPASVDDGRQLAGYTYITDPEGNMMRLNKPDYQVAAIYAATHKPPGAKEEIVESKLSVTPKEIFEAKEKERLQAENLAQKERESKRDDATKRYIASLDKKKDGDKPPELPFSPLPSILAGAGGYNLPKKLSEFSVAQVASMNPNWIDKNGAIKDEFKDVTVSIGTQGKNKYGVFELGENGKAKNFINESQLKSNAESWLALSAKERKGQEVYGYIDEMLAAAKATENKKVEVDEYGVPIK